MSDLKKYIKNRKKKDPKFTVEYEKNLEEYKLGVMLKIEREKAGLTQEELAKKIHTQKTAISRIENHAEDMKVSTLKKFADALGVKLTINLNKV